MTVEEMLDRMSAPEYERWRAYYRIMPFGESLRETAMICAMVGNAAGGRKRGGNFKPTDFLPIKTLHRVRQTGAQILSFFQGLVNGNNR